MFVIDDDSIANDEVAVKDCFLAVRDDRRFSVVFQVVQFAVFVDNHALIVLVVKSDDFDVTADIFLQFFKFKLIAVLGCDDVL